MKILFSLLVLFAFTSLVTCQTYLPYDTTTTFAANTKYYVSVNAYYKAGVTFTQKASSTCVLYVYHSSVTTGKYYFSATIAANETRYFEMVPWSSTTTTDIFTFSYGLSYSCSGTIKITQLSQAAGDVASSSGVIPYGYNFDQDYVALLSYGSSFSVPAGYKAVGTVVGTSSECTLKFSYGITVFATYSISKGVSQSFEVIPSATTTTSSDISIDASDLLICSVQYNLQLKARTASDKANIGSDATSTANTGAIVGAVLGTLFGLCCIITIIIIAIVACVFATGAAACCAAGAAGGAAAVGGAAVVANQANKAEAAYV